MIIAVGGIDINIALFVKLRNFIHKECMARLCSMEWGGASQHHQCCVPLHEECPKHHEHKGDPIVMPGTCSAIGERAQVILVWVRARAFATPPTHEDYGSQG